MLASSDLYNIRQNLVMERGKLIQSIQDQDFDLPLADNPDEEDLAVFIADQEIRSKLQELSEIVLERIEGALLRLETGTYGECRNCKREIQVEQLLSTPYAEFCTGCQAQVKTKKILIS